jgi:hypothetical protein
LDNLVPRNVWHDSERVCTPSPTSRYGWAVAESLYEEFKEPLYAAPPLLARMVDAGLLGRKSGRGFYTYA